MQTNPVDYPVELRVTGLADISALDEDKDIRTMRSIARQAVDILQSVPAAARVRDDWGQDGFEVTLKVDPDRANLAGVTNQDVAQSSSTALSGAGLTTLRRGDQQIPVVSRLRMEERATLSDIQNLYVYSSQSNNKVPLLEVSHIENELQTLRIRRLEHFRTISVQCFTRAGVLPSEVFAAAAPKIAELQNSLPPGYSLTISGEQAKQEQGFKNLAVIMAISIAMIFLALAFQFKHSIKPLLVLAAAPYGVAGALIALYVMGAPFGFMAFLGIASLIGVIVSHVIVLFDFIEEMHEGRAAGAGAAGCGDRAFAAGDDHGGRDDSGAFSAGDSRRTFVAAAVLRANRRTGRGYIHHAFAGAGALFHFCDRSENREVGRGGE